MTEVRTNGAGAAVPDRELVERPQRRSYSAQYKLRILREADACTEPGQVGAPLRREGLYTSHVTYWRNQREQGTLEGRARGRKPADRRDREIAELQVRLERSEAQLGKTRKVAVRPPSAEGSRSATNPAAHFRVLDDLRRAATTRRTGDHPPLTAAGASGIREDKGR